MRRRSAEKVLKAVCAASAAGGGWRPALARHVYSWAMPRKTYVYALGWAKGREFVEAMSAEGSTAKEACEDLLDSFVESAGPPIGYAATLEKIPGIDWVWAPSREELELKLVVGGALA